MIWDIILYVLSGALGVTLGTLFVGTTIGLPRRKKGDEVGEWIPCSERLPEGADGKSICENIMAMKIVTPFGDWALLHIGNRCLNRRKESE